MSVMFYTVTNFEQKDTVLNWKTMFKYGCQNIDSFYENVKFKKSKLFCKHEQSLLIYVVLFKK